MKKEGKKNETAYVPLHRRTRSEVFPLAVPCASTRRPPRIDSET